MHSGRGVAGRTRSRQGISWKQYFDDKRRKQREVELISSEEGSGNNVSDDDDDASLTNDIKPEEDNDKEMSERIQPRQVLNEREVEMASQKECSSSDTTESSDGGGDHEASPRDDVEKDLTGSGSGSTATTSHGDNDVEKDVTRSRSRSRGRGVASRTRSHFRASKLKNTKVGTFYNPISLDDEDEQEQEKEEHETTMKPVDEDLASSSTSSDEDESPKVSRKRRRKVFDDFEISPEHLPGEGVAPLENSTSSSVEERNPKVMAKPLKVSSKLESDDMLERLWAEMNMADENPKETMNKASQSPESSEPEEDGKLCSVSPSEDEELIPEDINPILSSKSTFGTKAPQPLEKSESEDESDLLWAELDDCLLNCEEDTDDEDASHQVENGHSNDPNPEGEESIASRCGRGDHVPAMNEEIGLVCIHCRHIIRDIKYCDPEFGKHPSGRPGGRYSYRPGDSDDSFSDDSEHENSGIDDKSRFLTYASTGTVWDIVPRAKKRMYSHQKEAFEFLWKNLAGGIVLDQLKKQLDFSGEGGCIISHAPGTGKTFLTIAFLKAFMRRYPSCRPMIIAPCNILNTWERELKKWQVGDSVPFHNLNKLELSGEETQSAISRFRPRRRGGRPNKNVIRRIKACSWREAKSILGISYPLFDKFARKKDYDEVVKKALFELPGLVVLDEAHTPRNARSRLWEALSNIKTNRRILLSGTPFQNNFRELINTLGLAKPNVIKGNYEFLLKSYDKVESHGERTQVISQIRDVIKPFVHVHEGTVLEEKLPGLKESVVSLKPSPSQMFIFKYIQKLREGQEGCSNWFRFEHLMSVSSVHPSLFVDELTQFTQFPKSERVQLNAMLATLDLSPEAGVKTKFVLDFIKQSELMKEKVLIFSQYLHPLDFLAEQINSRFHWREGEQMMIIHGKTHEVTRQASIDAFNDPSSKARVMLASTKACYEGINLVGASRVILLDTLWNPSAERQAVCRAYRLGQKKVVYTYRLITAGTWDEQKLCIQAGKDELSELVFSASHEADHMSPNGFEDKLLEKMCSKFGTKFTKRGDGFAQDVVDIIQLISIIWRRRNTILIIGNQGNQPEDLLQGVDSSKAFFALCFVTEHILIGSSIPLSSLLQQEIHYKFLVSRNFFLPLEGSKTAFSNIIICEHISALLKFSTENQRGTHLVKWDSLCQPKRCGGCRLKDKEAQKKAFLMKIGDSPASWHWLSTDKQGFMVKFAYNMLKRDQWNEESEQWELAREWPSFVWP
ncbi:hypothetical protein K1719_029202 [Acacia pycnantha]|nr:hypothetical protein K1719_029202 [Acacia pycnantha]